MQLNFPKNFYWGAATSAHQVEGGNHNDWTEWERLNAKRLTLNAQSKKWPEYILKRYPNPIQEENYISGKACDHYNRFRDDFDIAKSLGHNAHRFSIEWSRIEPEEGKFDEKEVEHYREVIKALRERGIEPFVTLWHFTLPIWIAQRGGWRPKETVKHFVRYCEKLASEFKDDVKFWIILNEPTLYVGQSYWLEKFPPQKRNIFSAISTYFNLLYAHQEAFDTLKKVNSDFQIGTAENIWGKEVGFFDPTLFWGYYRNYYFTDSVRNKLDFVGMNYYRKPSLLRGESDVGWKIYPKGIFDPLYELKRLVQCPIYITENGLADARDIHREKFIKEHLRWIHKAIGEGVDVRGYFHWSLLDNFEWDKGFWPRFGLVEVDYKTMERKIRPSALAYANICSAGDNQEKT